MGEEDIVLEIKELMEDRGYDLDQAIVRIARISGKTEKEVGEIYDAGD